MTLWCHGCKIGKAKYVYASDPIKLFCEVCGIKEQVGTLTKEELEVLEYEHST